MSVPTVDRSSSRQPRQTTKQKGLPSDKRQRYLAALWLALPALIGLGLFHFWPLFEVLRLGTSDFNIYTGESTWTGLDNLTRAASDPVLRSSLVTTTAFFLMKVPVQTAIALGLALFVSRPRRGIPLTRTAILLPVVTSMVVVTTVWGFMLNSESGLVNSVLGGLGLSKQPFLTDTSQALASIVFITIWKDVGLSMLFYLAGLMTIPGLYYEAAEIDGATRWQTFRYVTLPLLRPTTAFVLVISTIAAFQVFVPVEILTGGGPAGSTRVVVLYIFDTAFKFGGFSYAAAISALLMVILLGVSLLQLRATRSKVEA